MTREVPLRIVDGAPIPTLHGTSLARICEDLGQGASASTLSGDRVFLQHGPINLVIHADGDAHDVALAYAQLCDAFPFWLGTLVEELTRLRQGESFTMPLPSGNIARRMAKSVRDCAPTFATPMAAIAGAIADEAIELFHQQTGIVRAYVNNGGDIALYVSPGETLKVGIVADTKNGQPTATVTVDAASGIGGVATSGWQGRSCSFGIADAVTVLARTAATADVAATLVANAVDIEHPGIERRPANEIDEDTDLGSRLVTVGVPQLTPSQVELALALGRVEAVRLQQLGQIHGAALSLQGQWTLLGIDTSACAAQARLSGIPKREVGDYPMVYHEPSPGPSKDHT
ncbi:MAG: ApbE superfamily uncharacterized protein (UPF0280 family) [Gammaproteobacteria bacterium]|jgi:ApbE superfamily uncharacterized protein (UPF0280 family)